MEKFELSRFYSQDEVNGYVNGLKKERIEWLKRFEDLDPAILSAFKL